MAWQGDRPTMNNPWIVFGIACIGWLAYFYGVDVVIMEAQGLPVDGSLMPK